MSDPAVEWTAEMLYVQAFGDEVPFDELPVFAQEQWLLDAFEQVEERDARRHHLLWGELP